LVSWSTKIRVARNHRNKIDFLAPTTMQYFLSIKHRCHNYSPLFHSSMHGLIIPCILYMLPYLFPIYSSLPLINGIALPLPPHRNHYTLSILVHPRLLLLLLDQRVDHGGHVGHQEDVGEPRRCARQGGDLIQFRILESDFESNSESKTTLPSI
jgi:hypothetical protein